MSITKRALEREWTQSVDAEPTPAMLGLCEACLSSGRELDEMGLCPECDGRCPHCGAKNTEQFPVVDEDSDVGYHVSVVRCEACIQ